MAGRYDANEDIKKGFLAYVPKIKERLVQIYTEDYKDLVDKFGPKLIVDHKDRVSQETKYQLESKGIIRQEKTSGSYYASAAGPYSLDQKALDKVTQDEAEMTALQWYSKMAQKLGNLEDVKVSNPVSYDVDIYGRHGDNKVEIHQKIILNHSRLGTLFNQFPSHIYVNGKFQSEAQYKKTVQGWGVEIAEAKPKSRTKCLSCGYSGDTSTFPINERWAVDKRECPKCHSRNLEREKKTEGLPQIDTDVNLHPKRWRFSFDAYGRRSSGAESGNTQEEAIKKIRRYSPDADNFVLERVSDWHDHLIWDSKNGTPPPGPSTTLSGEDVLSQTVGQKKKYEYAYSYVANDKPYKTTYGVMAKTQEEADLLIAESLAHYGKRPDIYRDVSSPMLVAIYYKGKTVWRKPKKEAVIEEYAVWQEKDKESSTKSSQSRGAGRQDSRSSGMGRMR